MSGSGRAARGQVVIEMLLILPVFFTIIFTIMEMGNLAFQMILLNHATFEVARVAAMTRTPAALGSPNPREDCPDMIPLMKRIIRSADVVCHAEETYRDEQADVKNKDLVVTGNYAVPLIFPISNLLLSEPRGSGHRMSHATVRMPIERPLKR